MERRILLRRSVINKYVKPKKFKFLGFSYLMHTNLLLILQGKCAKLHSYSLTETTDETKNNR